jgi:hypothetical protein
MRRGPKPENLRGRHFGRWRVTRFANSKNGACWHCHCACGTRRIVQAASLKSGFSQSCGCVRKEQLTKHGEYCKKRGRKRKAGRPSVELDAYINAKFRCTATPGNHSRKHYVDRGIQFRFKNFAEWLKELGRRPGPGYSVDRINNDGHYEPGNVRWATCIVQQNNRRPRDWRALADTVDEEMELVR